MPALLETAPSRTAMMTAAGRAVHLFRTGPHALLADWFAWPLVGPVADEVVAGVRPLVDDKEAEFATWFAARARLTEDWLAASGAEQYVVLGAGLDSFAWRQPARHRGVRGRPSLHPGVEACPPRDPRRGTARHAHVGAGRLRTRRAFLGSQPRRSGPRAIDLCELKAFSAERSRSVTSARLSAPAWLVVLASWPCLARNRSTLPAALGELPTLEKLDLRWNRFARLPDCCARLSARGCVVLA